MKNLILIVMMIFSSSVFSANVIKEQGTLINKFEQKNTISFSTDLAILSFSSQCLSSVTKNDIEKNENQQDYMDNLDITFTDSCANMLSAYTKNNIGNMMTLYINNKEVISAKVVTQLNNSFRVSVDKEKFSKDIADLLMLFPNK